ncbi:uncharacterized protein LOC115973471 [Quercus lobata]|uniref:Myb-like domain-containing protein n=1 Tax=Quercus lobata TaxID=97700 RepID=A0A7N2RFB4_QUELO|nr:uncharacterized protein LOC115973471 [Quercus lobata]
MVQKRRFDDDDDEIFDVSSKLPRQLEDNNRLVSFSESVFPGNASQVPQTLEGGFLKGNIEVDEKLSDIFTDLPRSSEDNEAIVPGSTSISSWATSSTSEEDFRSEAPVHVSFFPEFFYAERPTKTLTHCDDAYSILFDHPPRKPVPTGPNHQADIPAWSSQDTKSTSTHLGTPEAVSDSDLTVRDEDEKRLMGTCVIPMPDLDLSVCNGDNVGNGRTDCSCEDGGSVRCVRQHITEARYKLLENVGQEIFVELGFSDMGEHVAQKWSEEEEDLFNEIVFSNPASLHKNFWKNLPSAFPSRTKKEIVSYYFNVFMLQRRAEQNRCDPMNIDSDNDEWHGSDDYGDNEHGVTEDEDSVVESPLCHNNPVYDRIREDDLQEYAEDSADGTCDDDKKANVVSGEGVTNISETNPKKLLDNCGSSPTVQLQDKTSWDERGDEEVQDDSCLSSDTGVASQGIQAKSENGSHWSSSGSVNKLSSGVGHEYIMEPCDNKAWDAGFMTCPKNKVDLLPTCSMIEEIFGDGSWK